MSHDVTNELALVQLPSAIVIAKYLQLPTQSQNHHHILSVFLVLVDTAARYPKSLQLRQRWSARPPQSL